MRPDRHSKVGMWETLTNYLCYLKELCMKYKIGVICVCQINRGGEERPSLGNLKGTGAIEEISDEVFLCYKKKEDLDSDIKTHENYVVDIAKNRFGVTGIFNIFAKLDQAKFYNNYDDYRCVRDY